MFWWLTLCSCWEASTIYFFYIGGDNKWHDEGMCSDCCFFLRLFYYFLPTFSILLFRFTNKPTYVERWLFCGLSYDHDSDGGEQDGKCVVVSNIALLYPYSLLLFMLQLNAAAFMTTRFDQGWRQRWMRWMVACLPEFLFDNRNPIVLLLFLRLWDRGN